jgi:glyoxylase-like metal-dependent hydrolase (beta-lactamase superfamily II)
MRIRRITTGRVRGKRHARGLRRYLPGDWSDKTLPVHAFAVEHPAGICLFDAGQTARAASPGYHQRWHPFLGLARVELTPEDEVASQLDPMAVRWVVLSHLHTDHVGGLHAFTHADVLVSRLEWERGSGWRGRLRGYVPQRWPAGLEPSLVDLTGQAAGPFSATYDVAGDGRLLMVPLPGHTPGHVGLIVDAQVLLAGDAPDVPPGYVVLGAHDPKAPAVLEYA